MTTNGYQLERVSGPAVLALTRDQAKKQCEVELAEDAHDTWFDEAIAEAHEFVEQYLRATLTESVWVYRTAAWPCEPPYAIRVPMGPLIAVDALSYLDTEGVRQELAIADFEVVPGREGYIVPAYGTYWPSARRSPTSIAVEYRAGYPGQGSPMDASGVPKAIVRGMKMLVGHWFENRETVVLGQAGQNIPLGFEDAVQPYRNYP